MSDANAYSITVLSKTVHSPTLFSFRTTRPDGFRFEAGQFVRLGVNPSELAATPNAADERIFRAYSVVSSPYDEFLEFFSVVVPDGAFTSQLQHLQVGDVLYLNPEPFGFLTLSRYQEPAPQDLWLLATGTGLAPFLSILQDLSAWQNYDSIVLAYSARTQAELAYLDKINALAKDFGMLVDNPAKFKFVPIVTREAVENCLGARLPALIADGALERAAGLTLNPATSHVMLCGNPDMVNDTKEALKNKGLTMNRRSVGNIAVENYW
ncbi:ferredoxin--NADP(+) reductase [Moraxella caviae]|uniref:ferredoxin--NADP(+) reductase n=1 Tax=Moraxella caviae TaxID=34060 RepID=A0A1S9ZYJ5_9GAMM|nr:ferredoxin--NADP reductase [Moraxella caviae]OOR88513.1 ferredoxin--NADP(+) reductase [Moraxella caviae]STZ14922.1 Ferredoxin--NADP reductase [Moraxella caviae]VEW12712.1 Ferredoxin--NADP reductase [Moraxella caviae]